jgi:DNA recombination protein RmuC
LSINPLVAVLILLAGIAIGAAVAWLASRPAQARLRSELDKQQAIHADRLKAIQDAESKSREAFQSLSADALKRNNEAFLTLAESRLREARTEAANDIDARKTAIENLLSPMAKTLEQMDRELRDAAISRTRDGSQLIEKIAALDGVGRNLRDETKRLTDALKRPGVRGRWGELQLKRVVELAGMVEHCDFEEQQTLSVDDRRFRPDVIVSLPGNRHVVIDAKVPLDAYLRALEAPDEDARQKLLDDHARQVRAHITQLAAKGYADYVQPSPDFVVMFLPGEMFLSAALEQDPTLIEFGAVGNAKRVIPASPTTLIALLRAVAYGWQQDAMEDNARKISELGKTLYESIRSLGGHVHDLGARLKSALDAYNQTVGSLEGNVLIRARKFKELHAANGGEEIKTIDPIDRVPRMLQAPELTDGLPFPADDVPEELEKV